MKMSVGSCGDLALGLTLFFQSNSIFVFISEYLTRHFLYKTQHRPHRLSLELMTYRRQHGYSHQPTVQSMSDKLNFFSLEWNRNTYVHRIKTFVYVCELELMRNIFIHLDFSLQVICNKMKECVNKTRNRSRVAMNRDLTLDNARQFSAPFHTPKRSSTPNTSSDQLESAKPQK
jgi:hypothetical protein